MGSSLSAVVADLGLDAHRWLEQHYWRAKRLWSGSYFAGSVGGAPISVLKQYIENQTRPA